jgi:hypothetical protein
MNAVLSLYQVQNTGDMVVPLKRLGTKEMQDWIITAPLTSVVASEFFKR